MRTRHWTILLMILAGWVKKHQQDVIMNWSQSILEDEIKDFYYEKSINYTKNYF